MRSPALFVASTMLLLMAVVASPTYAQLLPAFESFASASGNLSYDSYYESGNLSQSRSSRLGGLVSIFQSEGSTYFEASAVASPGALQAKAATGEDPFSYYDRSSANARAEATDWFVITGGTGVAYADVRAELTGVQSTTGDYFSGSSRFDYGLAYSAYGSSCYLDPLGCTPADFSQSVMSDGRTLAYGARPIRFRNELETDFLFRYDLPFSLRATLDVSASDGAVSDLSGTALFFLDLPEGAVLTTASGFGYAAAPVPEPTTWAMLVLGLAGLGIDRHRRRRARGQ